MASYSAYADGKPVISPDTGTQVVNYIRQNLEALRDGLVLGDMPGWTFTTSGGTAGQPATITYVRSPNTITGSVSWGVSGAATGNITSIVFVLVIGATSYPIGTLFFTYAGVGTLASPGYLTQSYWTLVP